jgi:RNA polymerase sigma-70 factor (ECF subfamily)
MIAGLASRRIMVGVGPLERHDGIDGRPGAALDAAAEEAFGGDGDLAARVAQGDQAAFADLYDRHAGLVYATAIRFLRDRSAAEEIVQETFLAFWNRASQYNPATARVSTWLLGIARNRSIDRLRAASRRPLVVTGDDRPDHVPEDGSPIVGDTLGQDPEVLATRGWVRAVVRSALDAMPDLDRRVLELAYDEQLSQSEIAARLGWPLGTVKTRTRRALLALRSTLGDVPDLRPRGDRT